MEYSGEPWFVADHPLTGTEWNAIAKGLSAAIRLGEVQAANTVVRITGPFRLYARSARCGTTLLADRRQYLCPAGGREISANQSRITR